MALSDEDREALLRAWPWPVEAATTENGFADVVAVVEAITAHHAVEARRAAVRSTLEMVANEIHKTLWRQGDRETRRRSYPAGVAWRSAANAAERIVRAAIPPPDSATQRAGGL